jgi:hypothetical protein
MGYASSISWVMSVCVGLRRSQAKTLSHVVTAALFVGRASMAQLGRILSRHTGVATKHCIKRVDRFVGNLRVEPSQAMRGVVGWLLATRGRRLLISLDWVEIRDLHCIVAAARLGGRAIPLVWAAYPEWELFRSQNNYEYGLLRLLRSMIPDWISPIIVADRGFGRIEMARVCQELKFHYIIRIDPDVWIAHEDFTGKLLDLPLRRGYRKVFKKAAYRKKDPVEQDVAVVWLACQREPWFLMTDLERIKPERLTRIYGRRMTIEEYFRDTKSKRNGFALRLTLIKSPQRLERMLLILVLAYIMLLAAGLQATKLYKPGNWCANNRIGECSLFTIGRHAIYNPLGPLRKALSLLRQTIARENWG